MASQPAIVAISGSSVSALVLIPVTHVFDSSRMRRPYTLRSAPGGLSTTRKPPSSRKEEGQGSVFHLLSTRRARQLQRNCRWAPECRTKVWNRLVIDREPDMEEWISAMRKLLKGRLTIYAYFNNPYAGFGSRLGKVIQRNVGANVWKRE